MWLTAPICSTIWKTSRPSKWLNKYKCVEILNNVDQNTYSPTCEIHSASWGWEKQVRWSWSSDCTSVWALRSKCPSLLVQRWSKTPATEWTSHPVWSHYEGTGSAKGWIFPFWGVQLQDKGCWSRVQCGSQRWFSFHLVNMTTSSVLFGQATNSDGLVCYLVLQHAFSTFKIV